MDSFKPQHENPIAAVMTPEQKLQRQVINLVDSYTFQLAQLHGALSRLEFVAQRTPGGLVEFQRLRTEAETVRKLLIETVDRLEATSKQIVRLSDVSEVS